MPNLINHLLDPDSRWMFAVFRELTGYTARTNPFMPHDLSIEPERQRVIFRDNTGETTAEACLLALLYLLTGKTLADVLPEDNVIELRPPAPVRSVRSVPS